MARRITHAFVKRLALCKQGKNGLTTLYKSDGTAEYATITKSDVEKGELLAVFWPKGLADDDGDFSDTDEAIESMTSSLIANGGALDIEHDGNVLKPEQARITEIFSIQSTDERFDEWKDYDGNVVDVTGGAAVKVQIDDPLLRQAHRDGLFDGVSLFGPAAVEQVDLLAASKRVAARMGGMQDNEMTKEELQAVLDAQDAKMTQLVKSAVDEAVKTLTKPNADAEAKAKEVEDAKAKNEEAKAPTFTGNALDADDLAEYEKSLRSFELTKAIQSGDMTADKLAEMRKSMSEKLPSVEELTEAGIKADENDSAEVRKLQVSLFKARTRSNVPDRTAVAGDDDITELEKSTAVEADAIAKLMNTFIGGAAGDSGMKVLQG